MILITFVFIAACASAEVSQGTPDLRRNVETNTEDGEGSDTFWDGTEIVDSDTGLGTSDTGPENSDTGDDGSDTGDDGSDTGDDSGDTGDDSGDTGTVEGTVTDTGNETDTVIDTGTGADPCDLEVAGYAYDFDTGQNGWEHGVLDDASHSYWTLDPWEHGVATDKGPKSCHGDSGACFATDLDDNYLYCQRAYLASPSLDLSKCQQTPLKLVFYHYYDFWQKDSSSFDGGIVEFSHDGGATWMVPTTVTYPGTVSIHKTMGIRTCILEDSFHVDDKPGYTLSNLIWERVEIPIPNDMVNENFVIRFAFGSGLSYDTGEESVSRSHTAAGWYIDDVSIEKR